MSEVVGVVGLGNMGLAFAQRLVHVDLTVLGIDPSPPARDRAAAEGVEIVDDPATMARRTSTILTSLPNGDVVRQVWLAVGGLLDHAVDGTVLVDLSTTEPQVMEDLSAHPHAERVHLVDAPVSGGPGPARDGDLQVLCGGTDAAVDAATPVLGHLGTILRTGPLGTGKTVKIVNNVMTMGNLLVAAEAFTVGLAAGVEPRLLYDVLSQTGGRSHHFVQRFPKAIDGDYGPGFALDLGVKDLQLGVDLAAELHLPTPTASLARSLYAVAQRQGLGDDDIVAILRVFEHWREQRPPDSRTTR